MSDDDLIRRGDALKVVSVYGTVLSHTDDIRALPAVVPGVKALVWKPNGVGREVARSIAGCYAVSKTGWSRLSDRNETSSENPKAAAQADYEARIMVALEPAPDAVEARTCQRCQGNGEIVTDWERYRHPHPDDDGDAAVADCPDCDGEGRIHAPAPQADAVEVQPVAYRVRVKGDDPEEWQPMTVSRALDFIDRKDYEGQPLYAEPQPDAVDALVKAADQSFFELIVDGMAEADRAMRKFPQPNYVISKVAEEAGEVVKAAIHCAENRETEENVRDEMRQLIAMLYRLWVEGDQVHGLAALRKEGGA